MNVGVVCFFFFFQAEDGIRDYKVTGVQTCALPISPSACEAPGWPHPAPGFRVAACSCGARRSWPQVEMSHSVGRSFPTDRKSTRLNSSHLVISYAVFCLKKKKESFPGVYISVHNFQTTSGDCLSSTQIILLCR